MDWWSQSHPQNRIIGGNPFLRTYLRSLGYDPLIIPQIPVSFIDHSTGRVLIRSLAERIDMSCRVEISGRKTNPSYVEMDMFPYIA